MKALRENFSIFPGKLKRELFPGRRSYYRGEWRDAQRILDRHIHSRSSLFERCEKPRERFGQFFPPSLSLSLSLSFFLSFLATKKFFIYPAAVRSILLSEFSFNVELAVTVYRQRNRSIFERKRFRLDNACADHTITGDIRIKKK